MAADLGSIAERLFASFMAPLVLGGALEPGRPIGARAALAIGEAREIADFDRLAHVQLGRVRIARRIVPIDRLPGPTPAEWALAAALHDIVQTTHPKLAGPLRRAAPSRLLAMCDMTIERIAPPINAAEAIARHTFFSRVFEIARTDTTVSWWVGESKFLGESAPARLTAWPELRRVHVDTAQRPLTELPAAGASIDSTQFVATLARWLTRTPLTDLAAAGRTSAPFAWTPESLALIESAAGLKLAARALALDPDSNAVDRALGRATKRLVASKDWKGVSIAIDLLADRALVEAQSPAPSANRDAGPDASFARGAGALAARRALDAMPIPEQERTYIATRLDTAAAAAPALDAALAPLLGSP